MSTEVSGEVGEVPMEVEKWMSIESIVRNRKKYDGAPESRNGGASEDTLFPSMRVRVFGYASGDSGRPEVWIKEVCASAVKG